MGLLLLVASLALASAAVCVAAQEEGSTFGRAQMFQLELNNDNQHGTPESFATEPRAGKRWWYHNERILTSVLEAAEATHRSNYKRRSQFVRLEDFHSEADVARLRNLPVDSIFIPTYPCALEKRLGAWVDGGKWVCFAHYHRKHDPAVLSIGSRGDTSFEQFIYKQLGVPTSTVDFSLDADVAQQVRSLNYVRLFEVGLYGTDESYARPQMEKPVKWVNIFELLELTGHTYVDIFKIDCEQCERGVFNDMKEKYSRDDVPFGQILVEFHLPSMHYSTVRAMAILDSLGYRLFHAEINRFDQKLNLAHYELCFIHESLVMPKKYEI